MSAAQELEFAPRTELSIVKKVEANPALVLIDEAQFEAFYEEIAREVKAHVPDLTTASGRKDIASLAYKVARTKTAIDDAGKKLTEDKRNEIKLVDASRKTIRERLDALKDSVRRPLTEWEAAEQARVDRRNVELSLIEDAGIVTTAVTAAEIEERIASLDVMTITPETFQEFAAPAFKAREKSLLALKSNLERIKREEEEREELARLRAEAAERERAEKERLAAEQAERTRLEQERAEVERLNRVAEEDRRRLAAAEENARRAVEAEAKERELRAEEAHAAELRRLQDEQEAERRAAARKEQDRIEAERAEQAEAERRAKDKEHRGTIMGAAKAVLMEEHKLPEAKAKSIVLAIAAGSVPHVSIRF